MGTDSARASRPQPPSRAPPAFSPSTHCAPAAKHKAEAQRGRGPCPRSHSAFANGLRPNPRPFCFGTWHPVGLPEILVHLIAPAGSQAPPPIHAPRAKDHSIQVGWESSPQALESPSDDLVSPVDVSRLYVAQAAGLRAGQQDQVGLGWGAGWEETVLHGAGGGGGGRQVGGGPDPWSPPAHRDNAVFVQTDHISYTQILPLSPQEAAWVRAAGVKAGEGGSSQPPPTCPGGSALTAPSSQVPSRFRPSRPPLGLNAQLHEGEHLGLQPLPLHRAHPRRGRQQAPNKCCSGLPPTPPCRQTQPGRPGAWKVLDHLPGTPPCGVHPSPSVLGSPRPGMDPVPGCHGLTSSPSGSGMACC